jgi:mono/diheme cytochrome c family protein
VKGWATRADVNALGAAMVSLKKAGLIHPKIPFIRREVVKALSGAYPSHDVALPKSNEGSAVCCAPRGLQGFTVTRSNDPPSVSTWRIPMKLSYVLACGIVVMGLARPVLAQDAKAIERGKAVFAEQKCSLCHAVAGKGNAKGPLDDVGSRLTADQTRQWLLTPKEMAEKEKKTRTPAMKPFTSLPKADLDALVAYLQTLKKK